MENYIKQKLFCENTPQDVEMSYIRTHYYELTRTRIIDTPPTSVQQIMESGFTMVKEFKAVFEANMTAFLTKYLNIQTYVSNFRNERFLPYNNLVMASLRTMKLSNERFNDWLQPSERMSLVNSNLFTSTISAQKSLIVEFNTLQTDLSTFKKQIPMIQGQIDVDTSLMFNQMKTETIDYLALIFLTAFEHQSSNVFSTQDKVLELYWETFYEWLELGNCEKLVNGAFNGALDSITNLEELRGFLNKNQSADQLDQIKLTSSLDEINALGGEVSDINNRIGDLQSWDFFTIEQLEETESLLTDIEVANKVKYDIIRLEDRAHCLTYISVFENFMDMKSIANQKAKYTFSNEYYYIIEYFLKMIEDPETLDEFPDANKRKKAIQIIYLFINKILLTSQGELNNLNTFGKRMAYLIIRILTEMDNEGTLRFILDGDVLDEETELYIYKLFIFITEKVDLPKPDESEELNKSKKKKVIEDDEEDPHTRINPQNPRFKKVIERFFVYANKPSSQVPKWVLRFRVKYFDEMMMQKNPMFDYDTKFFILEKKMAQEFETTYDFQNTKKEYDALRIEYLTLVKGLDSNGDIKPSNTAINSLAIFYVNKIISWVKDQQTAGTKLTRDMVNDFAQQTLLSHFGELQSNMIEKEYFKTIIFCVAKLKSKGVRQPDFKTLLVQNIHVTDRASLYEYMKRIITYIKHNKKQSNNKLVDTLDINTHHFDDQSGLRNGERFKTLMMDVVEFFEPELRVLERQHITSEGGQINYADLQETIELIKSQTLPQDSEKSADLENFRLMMQWNLFDDINEYLPLTRSFLEDTKSMAGNADALKMRLLIENYTNLYFIMIEHRMFCAEHKFSFEAEGTQRLTNLLAYLKWRNSQYESILAQPLSKKEIRVSTLNVREIQNLIYFLTYRINVLNKDTEIAPINITEQYFPYSFREIYLLASNHPEMIQIVSNECSEIFSALNTEKMLRLKDITKGDVASKFSSRPNFNFCVLYKFNIDMIDLVESRGKKNQELSGHQLTITREDIFNDLIAPYYDKVSPLHMVIQVFNLNMSHSSISASQTAATFSSYITLLDYFFQIIDDLKDGVNDTLVTQNLKGTTLSDVLVDFCKAMDNNAGDQHVQEQLIFLRSVLLERLRPSFYEFGVKLRTIFDRYTLDNNDDNVNEFVSKLLYGELDNQQYGYKPDGDIFDFRLMSLLMIYSPHSEFTVKVLHKMNLMSSLPKLIMNAKDNEGFIFKEFPEEENMNQVYDSCFKWMLEKVIKVKVVVDENIHQDYENGNDFDLNFDDLEDELYNDEENNLFREEEIVTDVNTLDSSIVSDEKTQMALIKVIDKVTEIQVEDNEEDLSPIVNEHFIKQSKEMSEDDQLMMSQSEEMSSQDNESFIGIKIRDSREKSTVLSMEGKNIYQSIKSGTEKHTVISNENQSVERQIINESANNVTTHNTKFMIHFNAPLQDSQGDLQMFANKQKMLQKLTNDLAQKLINDKMKNGSVSKAQVISVKQVSHRISMDSSSRLEESLQSLNETNQKLHFTGAINNEIVYSLNGTEHDNKMRSSKDGKVYSDALMGQLKNRFQDLVNNKMQVVKKKSKSFSGNSTNKPDFGQIKKKKTSSTTNFIRLV